MKYFICILLLTFLNSCSENDRREFTRREMRTLNYGDHTYIIWKGYQKGALIHDPDCKCHKEKND